MSLSRPVSPIGDMPPYTQQPEFEQVDIGDSEGEEKESPKGKRRRIVHEISSDEEANEGDNELEGDDCEDGVDLEDGEGDVCECGFQANHKAIMDKLEEILTEIRKPKRKRVVEDE
jgi:hypothetical protein